MRTMMKKSGVIAALTVALLVMVVLVTQSCRVPEADGPEMGTVRLVFGDASNARTILPLEPTLTEYTLAFTNKATSVVTNRTIAYVGDSTPIGSISLPAADYTLVVIGYDDATTPLPVSVATTEEDGGISAGAKDLATPGTGFTIDPSQTTTLTIETKPFTKGDPLHRGTFTWAIDLPTTTPGTATIVMTNRDGGAAGFPSASLLTAPVSQSVLTGTYDVDIIMTSATAGNIYFHEIAHIYRNMTSHFAFTFSNNNYYNVGDGNAGGGISYIHPSDPAWPDLVVFPAQANDGLSAADAITLSLGTPGSITVTFPAAGFSNIKWVWNGSTLGTTNILTATIGTAPFIVPIEELLITLEATFEGEDYALPLYFKVTL